MPMLKPARVLWLTAKFNEITSAKRFVFRSFWAHLKRTLQEKFSWRSRCELRTKNLENNGKHFNPLICVLLIHILPHWPPHCSKLFVDLTFCVLMEWVWSAMWTVGRLSRVQRHVTPHTLHLTPHLTPHSSHLTPHSSLLSEVLERCRHYSQRFDLEWRRYPWIGPCSLEASLYRDTGNNGY